MAEAIRVDQLLSKFGYCSRREAAGWVAGGRVVVGGKPVTRVETRVIAREALVDGRPVEFPEGLLLAMHKPIGYACSHAPEESPLIYDLLPPAWAARKPGPETVGRLDRETSGLILLTDEGAVIHELTSPGHRVEKCYEVEVSCPLPPDLRERFGSGELRLPGEARACLPARLEVMGETSARLYLVEGKYHQVRRMFASQGCPVTALHRTAIGALTLGDLRPGEWREVRRGEWLADPGS